MIEDRVNEIGIRPNPRILIVDDQAAIHSDFVRSLASEANSDAPDIALEEALFGPSSKPRVEIFELEHAYQGEEAVALVEAAVEEGRHFAVAFVDMRMPPGWDGLETIPRLWQVDPDIEIVICSAYSDYTRQELLEGLGHTDRFLILKKPFDPTEVVQLASSLSEKWRLARQTAVSMNQLQLAVDDLKATNDELERVGYVAAHHLQEPLRKISVLCDLLKRDCVDDLSDDAKKWFDSVIDCSAQARQLIIDLRAYSQAITLPVRVQRFDLSEAARAAVEELGAEIEESGGCIEVESLPEIESDPDLWRGVLRRLLENALRFSGPKPPRVTVTSQPAGTDASEEFEIAIKDNGIGIEARHAESVFMLFQRLHTKVQYPGSGAGLTICRRILTRLGSRIWIDSGAEGGTNVHIAIPSTLFGSGGDPGPVP